MRGWGRSSCLVHARTMTKTPGKWMGEIQQAGWEGRGVVRGRRGERAATSTSDGRRQRRCGWVGELASPQRMGMREDGGMERLAAVAQIGRAHV